MATSGSHTCTMHLFVPRKCIMFQTDLNGVSEITMKVTYMLFLSKSAPAFSSKTYKDTLINKCLHYLQHNLYETIILLLIIKLPSALLLGNLPSICLLGNVRNHLYFLAN